jgi:hypothetical protein
MQAYILLGGVKKFSQMILIEPYIAVSCHQTNRSLAIIGMVNDDFLIICVFYHNPPSVMNF